jgi:ubiquinol-cytochrome c reductase cytochrome b subunit
MAGVAFYGVLWLEGANDVLAQHFDVPLYTITEIARVAIFVVPILAYFITKRICLGLQRKDLHLLEHGVETGIIRQLPSGEFIEETRPVSDEALAKLTTAEPLPLPAGKGDGTEAVPPPGMRGGIGRAKARLNRIVTESVPMNGHGNGHGPDGHDADGEHARAAIGSPEHQGGDGSSGEGHQG